MGRERGGPGPSHYARGVSVRLSACHQAARNQKEGGCQDGDCDSLSGVFRQAVRRGGSDYCGHGAHEGKGGDGSEDLSWHWIKLDGMGWGGEAWPPPVGSPAGIELPCHLKLRLGCLWPDTLGKRCPLQGLGLAKVGAEDSAGLADAPEGGDAVEPLRLKEVDSHVV